MLVKSSIVFDGQAESALNFYKEIFNGTIQNLFRYADAQGNPELVNLEEKYKQRIMNARLDFGDNKFNVSDCLPNQELVIGNNIIMDAVFFDETRIDEVFLGLADGGQVLMPLTETFFSPKYGQLIDKYGIRWELMQMHN